GLRADRSDRIPHGRGDAYRRSPSDHEPPYRVGDVLPLVIGLVGEAAWEERLVDHLHAPILPHYRTEREEVLLQEMAQTGSASSKVFVRSGTLKPLLSVGRPADNGWRCRNRNERRTR